MQYELLDSGDLEKLERFGDFVLIRPSPSAIWKPKKKELWKEAAARFTRERGWEEKRSLPETWFTTHHQLKFKLKRTDFGHVGLFPEHASIWKKLEEKGVKKKKILNLFAYSGGATLALARAGAECCHLDASKGMVDWARENAKLNGLDSYPIRWIVDDALKFLVREKKRGVKYDGILLDPPSYGRGKAGEVFKIENHLQELLHVCMDLFTSDPLFFALSCHTLGYTPLVLKQLLKERFSSGQIEAGEMVLEGDFSIPSGSYAVWSST